MIKWLRRIDSTTIRNLSWWYLRFCVLSEIMNDNIIYLLRWWNICRHSLILSSILTYIRIRRSLRLLLSLLLLSIELLSHSPLLILISCFFIIVIRIVLMLLLVIHVHIISTSMLLLEQKFVVLKCLVRVEYSDHIIDKNVPESNIVK